MLMDNIKENEGFSEKPYIDVLVKKNPQNYGITKEQLQFIENHLDDLVLTFGYGFTYLTKEEAEAVLKLRLDNIRFALSRKIFWFTTKPQVVQDVLIEMAYQLGLNGLYNFKKTLEHIAKNEFAKASIEMLNSGWANQTPNRAKKLSEMLAKA